MKKILVLAVSTVLFAGLGACESIGKGKGKPQIGKGKAPITTQTGATVSAPIFGKAPVIGKGKAPVAAPIVVKG